MAEVLTFGETMAAFVPEEATGFQYVRSFQLRHAGAESNTAIGLSKLGHSVRWFSRLGDDEPGRYILASIRAEGVDVSQVKTDATHSTGFMLKSFRYSRNTEVLYYRSNSAASHMETDDISESLLSDCQILHFTGITPILSTSCKELTLNTLNVAKKNHIKISFDPNIRKKLWGTQDFAPLMKEIIQSCHILFMGFDEGEILYHTKEAEELKEILFRSANLEYLCLKNGSKGAYVCSRTEHHYIEPFPCHCIDSVGAGDAFNAGFLAYLLEKKSLLECGQAAAIAGALCTETNGDIEGIPDKQILSNILNHRDTIYR